MTIFEGGDPYGALTGQINQTVALANGAKSAVEIIGGSGAMANRRGPAMTSPYRCDRTPLPQSPGPAVPVVPPSEAALRQWRERYEPRYLAPMTKDLPADVRVFVERL